MTKATGRGRGWRKKAWGDLAPSTRKKYERYGIDAARHARGDSPRMISDWIKHQERMYGWVDEGENVYSMVVNGEEQIGELSPSDRAEILDMIRDQQRAERAYDQGDTATASDIWANRNRNLPEWMYYYHGMFSYHKYPWGFHL
jgi:hypothetical protein